MTNQQLAHPNLLKYFHKTLSQKRKCLQLNKRMLPDLCLWSFCS